jgi:hypothetical protein
MYETQLHQDILVPITGCLDVKCISFKVKFQYSNGQQELQDWTGVCKDSWIIGSPSRIDRLRSANIKFLSFLILPVRLDGLLQYKVVRLQVVYPVCMVLPL